MIGTASGKGREEGGKRTYDRTISSYSQSLARSSRGEEGIKTQHPGKGERGEEGGKGPLSSFFRLIAGSE